MSGFRVGKIHRHRVRGYLKPFCPIEATESILDIDPDNLREVGKKLVLLDVDNTLVEWRSEDIPETTHAWIDAVKAQGLGICILSNTRHPERLRRLSERLGIKYLTGRFKPSRSMYRQALTDFGVTEDEAIMIGDQLFTDILGANRTGIEAIWVKQMAPVDFAGTKISRLGEKLIRGRLYRHMATEKEQDLEDLPAGGSAAFELLKVPVVRQFVKFCVVGAGSTIIDVGLAFFLLTYLRIGDRQFSTILGEWLMSHISFLFGHAKDAGTAALPVIKIPTAGLAIVNSFYWNRRWTFDIQGKEHRSVQFQKFVAVSISGAILNNLISTGVYALASGSDKLRFAIASIVAMVIVTFWNYFGQKLWAFKHKH